MEMVPPQSQQVNHNRFGQPIGAGLAKLPWVVPVPPHEVMVGAHCRLEPLDVSNHAAQLYAQADCDDLWTYLPYGPFETAEAHAEWVREAAMSKDPQFYAVIDLSTGTAAGVTSYLRINPASGSIEVRSFVGHAACVS
jgi:RimJ/RimL family protein N-acetyltransferase